MSTEVIKRLKALADQAGRQIRSEEHAAAARRQEKEAAAAARRKKREAARLASAAKKAAAAERKAHEIALQRLAIAQSQNQALTVLKRWLRNFRNRNRFIHVAGDEIVPGRIEITVGLLDSPDVKERCIFRQLISLTKAASTRSVGITFLPRRRFTSAEALKAFLEDEFLKQLARPVAQCSKAYRRQIR